ncbi:IS1182 family transposase [Proteinivorax hydrogeniformans]|uniref:IS1182 family transposase n=1 Tax=Proteinivorax hydrogeniformans TaxID=1826727 RepID=A0AAU8HVA0_9FIRM
MAKIYQLSLPLNTAVLIPDDSPVRTLAEVLNQLDYTPIYQDINRNGRPPYDPQTLVKVIIYGYMNQIYSSRKIEEACKRDLHFIWLLEGRNAPDHNTISRFRQKLEDFIEELFFQFVVKLGQMGEISYENLFVDGSKLEANANKYTFVWRKAVTKHEQRLQIKIKEFINNINQSYGFQYSCEQEKVTVEQLKNIKRSLMEVKRCENIEYVYGKGKRKTSLQKDAELLDEYLEKQQKYDDFKSTFKGRNSFSKTDKDATFMRMKDDHMKNAQLKPGYNAQLAVEGEYIVGADISSERSDQLTFVPFMEKLKSNLPQKHKNIVADSGYESEENYTYLESENQNAYIKPTTYNQINKKRFKDQIGRRENMLYDEELDQYICQNGKVLSPLTTTSRKSKSGYTSKVQIYESENCSGCKLKDKCKKSKGDKRLYVAKDFLRQREKSLKNIQTPLGKKLRMNRSIQVEGAFGIIKEDYGFRKFLSRGEKNVKTEFLLLCFGFNLNKLNRKGLRKKKGVTLHELKSA